MTLETMYQATYIALETFRKNGQGVVTPVWPIAADGKLYVWTPADSWKVKRIRNNSHVRLCESNWKGEPLEGRQWVEAEARILEDDQAIKKQRQQLAKKYSWRYWLIVLINSISKRGASSVVLELRSV